MPQNKLFALLQLVAGVVATLLVVIGYFWFSAPLQTALTELDAMAGNAESEIETAEQLLTDVDGIAESVEKALPSHSKSLDGIADSTAAASNAIAAWENEIPGFKDIATDAAHICDTFAGQLPIRIPAVNLDTKRVNFELPEVIPKTQEVDIPYPTATVKTGSKKLTYPNGAKVEMKGWSKSFGRVAGKSLGSVSLDYPSGIAVSNASVDIKYPSSISIGTNKKSVTIPATPELKMKDYSFDIPDKLEVTHRDLMKDEKILLEKSSKQLVSMTGSLETTKASLARLRRLLDNDVKASIDETKDNLEAASTALATFRTERIPTVLSDLREQREGLSKSRGVFVALSGLIPLAFCVVALVTSAIAISGGAKFFVLAKAA